MKTTFFLLCLVAVSYAQDELPTRLPPSDGTRLPPPDFTRPPLTEGTRPTPDGTRYDPRENNESMCGILDRRCEEGVRCFERPQVDSVINQCIPDVPVNGDCTPRDFFEGDDDRERDEKVLTDRDFTEERVDRERGDGARERDTARTINGVEERPQCQDNLRCMENTCMDPQTPCVMQRMAGDTQLRCGDDGMFEPLQCRPATVRMVNSTQQQPIAVVCWCVRPDNGQMIPDTMKQVTMRSQVPECITRSFQSCGVMRDGRMVSVRHGEAVPMSRNNLCQRCECADGMLRCTDIDADERCPRSDPDQRPANCMMDGEEVNNGERRQDGKCNMCRCVNGEMRCTRVRDCRGEDGDAGRDSDRNTEDMMCDECMDMPNGPVCAVRDGRTFPTRCHAMRCQGLEMDELSDGPCSERNPCNEERCGASFSCMPRGGETKMSRDREDDSADDRRLCVDREQLRCQPTQIRADGTRRIRDDDEDDILEALEFDDDEEDESDEDADETPNENTGDDDDDDDEDEDDDDRTVCTSDGQTYPSTCHMIAETRGMMVPRVMHMGRCRTTDQDEMRMVCATDGVTYADEQTMRTTGGNVRMDYMGRCDDPDSDEDDTPAQRCMRARDNRCPNLINCTRRVMSEDGCCPVCGSIVHLAMDQDAMDEYVRTTDRLARVDDFMGQMFRGDGEREPLISDMAPRRCEISMTRPTKTPGNGTEILFRARNETRGDADYCHEQAMSMMMRLNQDQTVTTTVSTEESFIAAAIVAPEAEVGVPGGGTPAFVASCVMLISATLVALTL